jgi:hypothetical protein
MQEPGGSDRVVGFAGSRNLRSRHEQLAFAASAQRDEPGRVAARHCGTCPQNPSQYW